MGDDKVMVRYRGGETHQTHNAAMGVYELYSVDEIYMTGYVEIKDALGNIYPVQASLLEEVE